MNAAGAKHGAVSAEVRNSGSDQPQSEQRRGPETGEGGGTKCGKSAVKVRNLSAHSVSLPAIGERSAFEATPCLVPSFGEKTRRKVHPAQPPTDGAAWPVDAPRFQWTGMAPHELAVIDAALSIVALRLRRARRDGRCATRIESVSLAERGLM